MRTAITPSSCWVWVRPLLRRTRSGVCPGRGLAGDSAADRAEAALDLRRAERLVRAGDIAAAETLVRAAQARFNAVGDTQVAAIAAGQIADILQGRGETE